ncbi:MAG: polysaccharide biosynthesis tyrosine autokinase [Desulfobulbaceae bacterium]|nr:polysaccharide biosynthesis tyrosine autokinase [Desulfobulbaceae bacterium]
MVKISEALEKAGRNEGVELGMGDGVQRSPEALFSSPVSPAPITPIIEKPESTKALNENWDERLFKAVHDDSILPEVFKALRSRILYPKDGRAVPKTIMITSATPKEGKSFITANLGISLAQGVDQHSLLVDCDLRRPSLASLFGIQARIGLVDYLRNEKKLSDLICKTSLEKLSVLPSGKSPVNPSELLSSTRMSDLVEELSKRYDDRIIIFDTPPILIAAETSVLAGQVAGVILVVRQGGAGKAEVQKLIDLIGAEQIIGIVFNDWTINPLEKTLLKGYGHYYQSYQSYR